jgi:ferrochelatase
MPTSVLLLNHGAAEDTSGIAAFLENIFTNREIIRLPGGPAVQKRFARLIAAARAPRVAHLYRYMGGGSPLLSYMRTQADQLTARLDGMDVRVGLRYCEPFVAEAFTAAVRGGADRIVIFPQYPQYSTTTVGALDRELDRVRSLMPCASEVDCVTVPPFGAEPAYVDLLARRVLAATTRAVHRPVLVFSAHSVPMKFVDAGDTYPAEVQTQARLVAEAAGFTEWEVAYQSRSGPVRWLGPEVTDRISVLAAGGARHVLVVPISFVQDHLETIVEIDVQIGAAAAQYGCAVTRVRPVNADPAFADFSAELVRRSISDAKNRN